MTARPSVGTKSYGQATSGAATVTTAAQTVTAGSTIYVQLAMYGPSLSAPLSVSDSQTAAPALFPGPLSGYSLLQSVNTGSYYLWVFRRTSPLAASSSSFTVTVTPASATTPIIVMAIEVHNDGGADASATSSGTSVTSATGSVATSVTNDLVLFLGADTLGTLSGGWGTGQTGITGYPTETSGHLTAWGSYQSQPSPGTASSSLSLGTSSSYVAVSLAISPLLPWPGIAGRPYVTVSPIGQTTSPASVLVNNGADFGPDTPNTLTSGIQEALNSIGGLSGSLPSFGSIQPNESSGAAHLQTPVQTVSPGSGIYVQVAMYGTGLTAPTLTDTQSGTYDLLAGGSSGSGTPVWLWVFRRTTGVGASTTFQVTVTPSSSSDPIQIASIEVLNDGGMDVDSAFQSNTSTTESATVTTSVGEDLILFLGADINGASPSFPAGQTGMNYGTSAPNIVAWGSYQTAASPSSVTSKRTISASVPWAAISVAIRGATPGGTVRCRGGNYVLSAPIGNTGNYQSVVFEPGSVITGVQSALNLGGTLEALIWVAQNVASASFGATAAFHHIRWIGNGCIIDMYDPVAGAYIQANTVIEYSANGPLAAGFPQAFLVEIDNFEIRNLTATALYIQTNNGFQGHPISTQQASEWKISRLYVHSWPQLHLNTSDWVIGISSVREVVLEDIYIDGSTRPVDAATYLLFIFATRGDTSDIRVTDSLFIDSPAPQGIVCLLGSSQSSAGTVLSRVQFQNCVFQSPAYNSASIYITDDFGSAQTTPAVVTDFEFKACEFNNAGINLESKSSTNVFGYGRVVDSRFTGVPGGSNPVTGTLPGRGPGAIPQVPAAGVPGSGHAYTNNDGFDETVLITAGTGGSVTQIQVNGITTGQTAGAFFLRTGDQITITYTAPINFLVVPE